MEIKSNNNDVLTKDTIKVVTAANSRDIEEYNQYDNLEYKKKKEENRLLLRHKYLRSLELNKVLFVLMKTHKFEEKKKKCKDAIDKYKINNELLKKKAQNHYINCIKEAEQHKVLISITQVLSSKREKEISNLIYTRYIEKYNYTNRNSYVLTDKKLKRILDKCESASFRANSIINSKVENLSNTNRNAERKSLATAEHHKIREENRYSSFVDKCTFLEERKKSFIKTKEENLHITKQNRKKVLMRCQRNLVGIRMNEEEHKKALEDDLQSKMNKSEFLLVIS